MIPNLALGIMPSGLVARIDGFAIGLLDLARVGELPVTKSEHTLLGETHLNAFLALGPQRHREIYEALYQLRVRNPDRLWSIGQPIEKAPIQLGLAPGDFVDFYASRHHAARCARLTGNADLLPEAWDWMPLAYHGRTAGIVGSNAKINRPSGWMNGRTGWALQASRMLDYEMELGFVMRHSTEPGEQLTVNDFDDAVFGAVLVIDWSARDLQGNEAKPLGPFHSKAFATQVGHWIVPLEVLARCSEPADDLRPKGRRPAKGNIYDIRFEAMLKSRKGQSAVAGSANLKDMGWTPAEMMAHLTQSGAPVRSGDLFATGTISGPGRDETGCLLERFAEGTAPLMVGDEQRHYLADGDKLSVTAHMQKDGQSIAFDTLHGSIAASQTHREPSR
ncbi:fumarylacetoacetate hydrolase family protein [Erythrobacter mangrovi]|uniref:Fumarylacetoacetate hydrolase family protein n=1 Tax=Erythrobacter mangrovi TaxID=2739433 RepID=A0A7D3XQP0_9SPHN|nr:fumarylacetoacetate hydrolase family protein [Erythrobacter mangrovi]QKG70651.1 fumarylacetoacetate hydrolase family protein [Erythrobacter mangrovi]